MSSDLASGCRLGSLLLQLPLPPARPRGHPRARLVVACDWDEYDESELEDALERYASWGLLENKQPRVPDYLPRPDLRPSSLAEDVEKALEPLMDAVKEFEGSLEVLSVDDGAVRLAYVGPAHFKAAVELALKDVPRVADVSFV